MPCKNAMITDVITVSPDHTVEEVLKIFYDKGIRGVPIIENDEIVGVFHFKQLLTNLLPVNVVVDSGSNLDLRLDYVIGAAPGIAKRLRNMLPVRMRDLMEPVKDLIFVTPDTPLWEGVRLIVKYDSPLMVVDEAHSKHLKGIISSQTIVKALMDIATDDQK